VYTAEHGAWPVELANEFEKRANDPLRIEELTSWKSRTWDGACARHAFGFVHHVALTRRAEISTWLDDLRRYRDANNRRPAADGTWTRDPAWEPPAEAQDEILRARWGGEILAEASAWLAKQGASSTRTDTRGK